MVQSQKIIMVQQEPLYLVIINTFIAMVQTRNILIIFIVQIKMEETQKTLLLYMTQKMIQLKRACLEMFMSLEIGFIIQSRIRIFQGIGVMEFSPISILLIELKLMELIMNYCIKKRLMSNFKQLYKKNY